MSHISPILRAGMLMIALMVGLVLLSYGFPYGARIEETPLAFYLGLALVAGIVWALLPRAIGQSKSTRSTLITVLLIGLVLRVAMFLSLPVLEDDSYRYLWDGAVTAHGIDPYKYAPAEAAPADLPWLADTTTTDRDLRELKALAEEHPTPHSRINYPFVSTIYPPIAQAAFASAYFIDPFGLSGWRLILLAADLSTVALLLALLRAHNRNRLWVSLYWWNPVVIIQAFGAGHMDLLLLPFVLAALLFAHHQKMAAASLALAGAAAVKIWPVLLFPLLVRPLLRRPGKLVAVSALFAATTLLALLPQLLHAVKPEAGLNVYATEWRTHAFLFAVFEDLLFAPFDAPGQMARALVAVIMLALTGWLAWPFADQPSQLPALAAIIIASLIFLSPTGYPWYLIWLAPFLAFLPHPGLLCLTALAPLYWLRFQLGDDALLYQWGIVPIAFGVPLWLIAQSVIKRRSGHALGHHYSRLE